MSINIGIKPEYRSEVSRSLNILLADEYVLYTKTRNAHWNVEGPEFYAMHQFFEDQYTELEQIIDDIAERIRALGHFAVATLKDFLNLTHLSEQIRSENSGTGFIRDLLADHETIVLHMRNNINRMANEWHDAGTSDFITELMEKHEKMAWMLRAHIPS
jgi:starvation-inducible DNA-binding protein